MDTAYTSGAFAGQVAYKNVINTIQNLIYPLEKYNNESEDNR